MCTQQTNYKEQIPEIIKALQSEIDQAKNQKSYTQDLEDGLLVDMQISGGQTLFLYSFTTDSELQIPADTLASLTCRDKTYDVTIVSVIEYTLLLSLSENLGKQVSYARLSTEPWFLLVELQKRLQELITDPDTNEWAGALFAIDSLHVMPPAMTEARSLLSNLHPQDKLGEIAEPPPRPASQKRVANLAGKRQIFDIGVELQVANAVEQALVYNEHQLQAVGHILANQTSYIWGPPGTGKSRTLGMAAAALFARGESVLVLAHSNAAVDVALANVARHLTHTAPYHNGLIVRHGPTTSAVLPEQYPQVLTRHILQNKHPDLVGQLDRIEKRLQQQMNILRENASSRQNRLTNSIVDDLRREREKLRIELNEKEKLLVTQACIVACTLSKATISQTVYALRSFDAVFIDEASMAYIPHCLFAAGWLASKRIAFFGDFRQLDPIARAEDRVAKLWLQRDVFELAGIRQKLEAIAQAKERPTEENRPLRATPLEEADPRLVMLRTQYRMHPDIAAVPNRLYYYNLLQNGPATHTETAPIVTAPPFPKSAIAIMNTALLDIYCFSDSTSGSRFNPVSALITAIQARQALANQQGVGIVTPYNAQARLINRILRESDAPRENVLVATVHKFQGSERDLMIFDLVEGKGKMPGLLFSDSGSGAARLTNVAISRAKGKFIYVLDHRYVKDKFSDDHALRQFTNAVVKQVMEGENGALLHAEWPQENVSHGIWNEGELPNVHCYPQSRTQADIISERLIQARKEIAISWPDVAVSEKFHFSTTALLRADQNGIPIHLTGQGSDGVISHLTHGFRYHRKRRQQTWYQIGVVCVDQREMWLYLQPRLDYGTIIHIALPKTVAFLREMFDLVPSEKWRQIHLDKNATSSRNRFSNKTNKG
jgi:hypothetical protein